MGNISNGDEFLLGGKDKYLMTSLGLFGGTDQTTDKLLFDSTASSVVFTDPSTPNNLSSAWYKILEADNGALNISNISSIYDSNYKGVIIADSEKDSQKIYGQLLKVGLNDHNYEISSIAGSTASLSGITLEPGNVSEGVAFPANFAGESNAPTIKAEGTTFTVKKSNSYFILSGEKNKSVALSGGAQEITLIEGSLNTAVTNQTITAGNYTLSNYIGDTNNDGVVIYSDKNNQSIVLSDLETGEQFNLTNGTTSGTFKVTNVGLAKIVDGNELLLARGTATNIFAVDSSDDSFSADTILGANTVSGVVYADAGEITISSSSKQSFISYQNMALATLSVGSNTATLKTSKDYSNLHPGEWSGIKIGNDINSIVIDNGFTGNNTLYRGDGSNLKIATGVATFGIVSVSGNNDVTLKTNYTERQIFNNNNVAGFNLINGKVSIGSGKLATLASAGDIEVQNTGLPVGIIESSTNGATITTGADNVLFNVGRGYRLNPYVSGSIIHNIIIDKDGNTSVRLDPDTKNSNNSKNLPLTLDASSEDSIVVNCPGGNKTDSLNSATAVTIIYGKTKGNDYATDLDPGDIFTVAQSGTTKTYRVTESYKLLVTESDSLPKFWNGNVNSTVKVPISSSHEEEFTEFIINDDTSGNFTLDLTSADTKNISMMSLGRTVAVVDSASYEKIYGYLTKTASNKFSFTKGNATYDFNSITINGNAIVDFDSSFQNVTINVKGSTDTKFLSASSTNFTVNNNDSATGAIWVDGTNEVSLANGTLWSSLNAQSITAGDYTVTPNLGSGKAIYLSASSSDKIYIVGDIDPNEAFNVNDTLYTYNPYPVGLTSSDGKVLDPKYYADPGLVNETSKLAVTLGNLIDEANFGTLLSATDGVFSIGSGDNTVTGTVVDDKAKATKQYAQLEKVGFGGYALATIKNASTWDSTNASTIAVAAGANATINTSLVSGKAIFAETSGATFKVIESSGDTFTIDGSNGAPTIENASIINLLGGKITAIQNQTIKLGENTNSPSFVLSSNDGVTITYNKDNSTFNIDGAVGDSFSLGGKEYTVVNGDGMNFIVDSSGNVTVDNLANDYTQDGRLHL